MNRIRINLYFGALIAWIGLSPSLSFATVKLGSLFSDHMVLQCDMPVPIWGTAEPGETITVEFAGQTQTTVANTSNHWEITLDPMAGSFEPLELTVHASIGNQQSSIINVVVGEVWICSGQSNMQMGFNGISEIRQLETTAKNIRTFEVKRTVALTEQDSCEGQWVEHHPNSAVAFSFAYFLEEAAEVPVGIILTCWGSSSLEAWMPRDLSSTLPYFKTMMDDFEADTETNQKIQAILNGPKPWSGKEDVFLRRQSNILYNAMMAPLVPYACRGMVWYQGERNTKSMYALKKEPWFACNSGMLKYGEALQAWMTRYRKAWGQDEFQFLVVMLPGYAKDIINEAESPTAASWAWIRESQLQALELPNTAVANTIDLGDVKNIHPKDKLPIGQRLALLAQRDTLEMDIEAQGPIFQRLETRGKMLELSFDHANGLATSDGEAPKGFWLSDGSGKWVPAAATIKEQTVVVQAAELNKPLYVRYAFAGKPQVNLINGAGLPAYPFRTDRLEP